MIGRGRTAALDEMLRYIPTAIPGSAALVRPGGRRRYAVRYIEESDDSATPSRLVPTQVPVPAQWNASFVVGAALLGIAIVVGALLPGAAHGKGWAFTAVGLAVIGVGFMATVGFSPVRPDLVSLAEVILQIRSRTRARARGGLLDLGSDEAATRALRRLAMRNQTPTPMLPGPIMGRPAWARTWQSSEAALPQILSELDEVQREIVRLRWLEPARDADRIWRTQRIAYYLLRAPIIVAAATVPVLASLNVPKIWTALLGLVVAVLTGLDTFFQYGLRWQQRRRAAIEITVEGWQFLELSGPHYRGRTRQDAYQEFLGHLEDLSERLALQYLDLFSGTHRDRSTGQQDDHGVDAPV